MKTAKKIRIAFVTGSRAEYDRVVYLLKIFKKNQDVRLSVIATGTHLSEKFGMTVNQILRDGFRVAARVKTWMPDSSEAAVTRAIGRATIGFADVFRKWKPDAVMVFGDRAELLAVAAAAVCQKIPLIHLCGGEITEGAIDDQVRHMLTKAAHLHFAANSVFAERLLQMGEERWRVFAAGSPALDLIYRQKLLTQAELSRDLKLDLSKPTALVTYHPVTLGFADAGRQTEILIKALRKTSLQLILTYPNADAQSDMIIKRLKQFAAAEPGRVCLVKNLGMLRFLSALKYVRLIVGNSSSGIVEAPSFSLPAVNIGSRQGGRVFGRNVISAECTEASIAAGIRKALRMRRKKMINPYGNGKASEKIVAQTVRFFRDYSRERILLKKFSGRGMYGKK